MKRMTDITDIVRELDSMETVEADLDKEFKATLERLERKHHAERERRQKAKERIALEARLQCEHCGDISPLARYGYLRATKYSVEDRLQHDTYERWHAEI